MKRIATVMIVSLMLAAFAKFSPLAAHRRPVAFDDAGGDGGDDSGDDDSGNDNGR